ncbi:purine and uridine phosphorylase [Aspergillus pseudotamarii]|uniref:Purine and uridine phosphorylase n=1 Tax=Aspergillus pseudotamarii TaxID=132259 RepID=A0A5N6T831_ASPPS|nr:purine and uridine phosphorylase [Aspergillus pseudotamarii]KAE8142341.1 purine and uridine phosphorylase [Aspergillus pseudotamarii]
MSCPPPEEFQIGWICALPVEAAAAKEMLDENFGILDEQDTTDPNIYTLGRIGKHNIVIACLPAGQYGNTAATTVANHMVRTFSKSLRIGLMVGVGGGIPSATCDIRLGDIVISCPTGTCGGVLQYDMGKVGSDGKFTRVGSLNSPPRSLLAAVSMMRTAELTDDPHYPEYLRKAIGRTRKTQKTFAKPNQHSDRLFQIRYDHPATADNCDVCLREWEETRSEREDNEPQTHYGIIASGNSVIKHGRTREQLRTQTGALCFEMEAAGLMLDFPCIVIRGICDYSDSHKNKQWQGYAALAAASYTKELLGYIPKGQVSQEGLATDVCRSLEDLNRAIKSTNDRLDKAYDQRERYHTEHTARVLTEQQKRCHQVFKISNYEQHKNINPDRVPGTCQWALQNPSYLGWWNSCGNDLLWISADPGCGKSVLSKSLIDNDIQACGSEVSVCYFFFKDNDEQNNLATALCAILHQLFSQYPSLLRHAVPCWEKNGERLQQEPDQLWRILLAATSDPTSPKTICVLDALDECRPVDQKRLIQRLTDFYNQATLPTTRENWLKFLVTSRPYDDIQNNFKPITDLFPHIRLQGEQENKQIHGEIDLVVKTKVKELAETSGLPADVEQRIADQLLQMQHRTYLWLYLAIDDIRNTFQNSLRPADVSIVLVPESVYTAYEKILSRVPSGQKDIAKKILRIIVGARRPLTIEEMSMALGVAANPELGTAAAARLEPTRLSNRIRKLCGLFVFINNSKIYLIHQTAREFLIGRDIIHKPISEYSFELPDADKEMSQICIRYLQMDDLEDRQQLESNIQCFLSYSAVYWADHVRGMSSSQQQEMVNLVHGLYSTTTSRHELWFSIFWKTIMPLHEKDRMNAVHLAAFNGHSLVLKMILATEENIIDAKDSSGATGLICQHSGWTLWKCLTGCF